MEGCGKKELRRLYDRSTLLLLASSLRSCSHNRREEVKEMWMWQSPELFILELWILDRDSDTFCVHPCGSSTAMTGWLTPEWTCNNNLFVHSLSLTTTSISCTTFISRSFFIFCLYARHRRRKCTSSTFFTIIKTKNRIDSGTQILSYLVHRKRV